MYDLVATPSTDDHFSAGKSQRGEHLQILHTAVPGRIRFKLYGLYRNPELKQRLETRLPKQNGLHRVQANSATGNLLVGFDAGLALIEVQALIEAELTDLPAVAGSPRPASSSRKKHGGRLKGEGILGAKHRRRQDSASTTQPIAKAWHTLEPQAVVAQLNSSENGLSQAEVATRLTRYGPNSLAKPTGRSNLSLVLEQFLSPPVIMLGISATVSVLTGGALEAVAIVSVVLVNAVIGFATERQSETTIAALMSDKPHAVTVVRAGVMEEIPAAEVVIGDVVVLTPGTFVPADARLLATERLSLDESALTGESMAVEKQAQALHPVDTALGDRDNMVYMGTLVTGGSGRGLVVGTALATEIGRIQALAAGAKPPATPVERQLDELGGQLAWLSSAICGVVFVVGLVRGYGWLKMLKSSISLAVAAVPEGLAVVATTTLALGIRDMQRRKVLVRRLDAVETLGSVQFFCFDKTGTLTLNRMVVVAIHVGMQRIDVVEDRFIGQQDELTAPLQQQDMRRFCEVLALCNEAELEDPLHDSRLSGSATEQALVQLALQAGVDVAALRRRWPQVLLQHRAQNRPYMVTLHQQDEGEAVEPLLAVKGSPEEVLALCRYYQRGDETVDLDTVTRAAILRENEHMAGEALRVLGAAYGSNPSAGDAPADLVWLGLAGMADPLRPGMNQLLHRFHQAGINTAMITGDQSATAYAIAKQLDLANGRPVEILDSTSLNKLDADLLGAVVQRVQVFARVSPAHKLQIVQALQKAHKVVAMTGDGINDGPALKAADLGVAMGSGGTEVARSLADVILQDDNLATMEVAVRHGRSIYNNVRKAIRFLLSTNLSEIEVMLAGIGLGLGEPLNPMQLLWINLITDIFPGLALAMEAPEPDIMDRPPRDPREPIIAMGDLRRMGLESAVISAGTLASYSYALRRYGIGPRANTHAFMTLTLGQLLHALSSRSEQHTLLERRHLPPNPYLSSALGLSLGAQLLTVLVPGLRKLLGTTPLGGRDALMIGAGAMLPLLINEVTKNMSVASRKSIPHLVRIEKQEHKS